MIRNNQLNYFCVRRNTSLFVPLIISFFHINIINEWWKLLKIIHVYLLTHSSSCSIFFFFFIISAFCLIRIFQKFICNLRKYKEEKSLKFLKCIDLFHIRRKSFRILICIRHLSKEKWGMKIIFNSYYV